MSAIRQAAGLLRNASYVVALTGAGVSTPSGIPDFRTPRAGVWSYVDPMEVASLWSFHERPQDFYRWIAPLVRKILAARPNPAHRLLADLEARGPLKAVVTQNVDSLHQLAGSRCVLELHGHARTAHCLTCGYESSTAALWPQVLAGALVPRCPRCEGLIKPDVILFGEPLPYPTLTAAQQHTLRCDVMLVMGTSLEVMPAADLPLLARRRGARTILINASPTTLDEQMDVVVHEDLVRAAQQLQALMR